MKARFKFCRIRPLKTLASVVLLAVAAAGTQVEHKTRFDPEMIPGIRGQKVALPLSNSRQLVRTASGEWLLAFDVPGDGLYLCRGPAGRTGGSRFSEPVLLVGEGAKAGVFGAGEGPTGVSLALDGNLLHVAWSDKSGVRLGTVELPAKWSGRAELVAPGGVFGDITLDAKRRVVVAYSASGEVFVATRSESGWDRERAAPSGSEPVMDFDAQGNLHVAYRQQRETPFFGRVAIDPRIFYVVREQDGWTAPDLAAHGVAFHPAIAVARDGPVIAYQHEGIKRVEAPAPDYPEQREGGGASVGYAARRPGAWNTGYISRAEEILVRDRSVADAFKGRVYPMVEQKWRPRVAVDKYGIPWAFWADTTRRHTYFARWLGSGFSDQFECRGGYYAPSEYITAEKHMPRSAGEIGFAYAAAGRLYFGTVPVPSLSTRDSRHVLFLDMLEVSGMRGAEQGLNRFTKYQGNPVFRPGEPGSFDDYGVTFPNVRRDGGKFTMEYFGHAKGGGAGIWKNGYAESADGIHWTRPNLGLIEHNGSRANNIVPWVSNFIDHGETDPKKRYKGVLIEGHWITDFRRKLAFSPDGVHWTYGRDTVNLTSMLEGGGPSFRDDLDVPERRFKSVGRTISQNHRSLGMMWSPDLVHWYGDEAVLDVHDPYGAPAEQWRGRYVAGSILDPSGDKAGDQIYWGNVWIESGLYLCLYAPYRYDGGYQAAFAMSRDGYNFVRVRNGEFILPRGPAGAWDSGFIAVGYGVNVPLRVRDRMRLYYGGVTTHHGTDPWRASAAIGMAEVRVDGWAFVAPSDNGPAQVTTIPVEVASGRPARLRVNAEIPEDASIQVEVLEAGRDAAVAGYAQRDCRPVASGVNSTVAWAKGDELPRAPGPVRLRFHLNGAGTRLYSFWFE